jgi:hypothetical protein
VKRTATQLRGTVHYFFVFLFIPSLGPIFNCNYTVKVFSHSVTWVRNCNKLPPLCPLCIFFSEHFLTHLSLSETGSPAYRIRYVCGGNIFEYFVGFTGLHITNYGQNKEGKADGAITSRLLGQIE